MNLIEIFKTAEAKNVTIESAHNILAELYGYTFEISFDYETIDGFDYVGKVLEIESFNPCGDSEAVELSESDENQLVKILNELSLFED
jgi:hypothetical protein